jgi:hypothetical protein
MLRLRLIFVFVALAVVAHAQKQPRKKKEKDPFAVDTTLAYVEYPQRLFVGYNQSLQSYTVRIAPDNDAPFSHRYSSGSKNISGFEVGYGKLFVSFTVRSVPNNLSRTGNNKFNNVGFNIGSNKWQFEGLYQHHRGFYDANSPDYNVDYISPNPYYRKGGLVVNLLQFKGLYYVYHKRYSVKATQGNNFHQLRSAVSPIIGAGFFRINMKAHDGLLNPEIAPFYGHRATINRFASEGLSVGGGLAGTLVFLRKMFVNGTALIFLEPQFRTYRYADRPFSRSFYSPFNADFRATTGYNTPDFYAGIWLSNSTKKFNGNDLRIRSSLPSAGFAIGFRIKIKKEPKWVQAVKANKFYQSI